MQMELCKGTYFRFKVFRIDSLIGKAHGLNLKTGNKTTIKLYPELDLAKAEVGSVWELVGRFEKKGRMWLIPNNKNTRLVKEESND